MKYIIMTILALIIFAFGYSLARFTYINQADKDLIYANSLIKIQRDGCFMALKSVMVK